MTKDEISSMQPGKELDRKIAEFMGVDEKIFNFAYEGGNYNYSTDISAAWEVVEKLKIAVIPQSVSAPNDMKYLARIEDDFGQEEIKVFAFTAPEAICKAALLALEGEQK